MRFRSFGMHRSAEIADAIVRWCAVLLIALLPFFFIPVSWVNVVQAKMFLVAFTVIVATGAWVWGRYISRSFTYSGGIFTFAALSLPIVYLLSALASGRDAASFVSGMGEQDTVVVMFLLFALFFLSTIAFKSVEDATMSFVRSITAGGLVLIVLQLLHLFIPFLTFGILTSSAASVFGSWHELGVIAGLFVFFALTLGDTPLFEGRWKWALFTLGALSAFILLIVNVADVWYVFGVLVIVFGIYQWRSGARHAYSIDSTWRVIAMSVVGLIALICGYGGTFIYNHTPARLQVLQTEVRPSWQGTFAVGQKALTGAGPVVFGSGPNTFTREWSLNKPAGVNATTFWNADFSAGVGFIPTTFVTVGLIGVLSWLFVGIALVTAGMRFFGNRRHTSLRSAHAALFAAAFYLAVIHVMYVPSIGLSALTFILFGLVALIGSSVPPSFISLRTDRWTDWVRVVVLASIALAVVLSALLALRATLSDMLVNKSAAVYATSGNIQYSLNLVEDALAVYPNNDRAHRAAVELGLLQLSRLVAQGGSDSTTIAALQGAVSSTIQHGLDAVNIDGADYRNWLSLATLYQNLAGAGVKGAYENARTAFEKAHADNPTNPQPLLALAQLDIAEHNSTRALEYLDQALTLKPDFAAAYLIRSQVEAGNKDYVGALADANEAVKNAPNDAQNWYNMGVILYAQDDFSGAVQPLERATVLQADYANALFVLGVSYEKLGRHDEAVKALTRVSQLNPGDPTIPQMIRNIQAGLPMTTAGTSTVTAPPGRVR